MAIMYNVIYAIGAVLVCLYHIMYCTVCEQTVTLHGRIAQIGPWSISQLSLQP